MTTRAYTRISVASAESGALTKQRSEILAREAEPDAVQWYTDEGVSGAKGVSERPRLAALLADLVPGDRLVCTKVDRLARSVSHLSEIAATVKAAGAELVFTGDPIDTSSPSGGLMLHILGALAEFERELVRERVTATRRDFLSRGRHMGRAPFGFSAEPAEDADGLRLRPHPVEGPLLREAISRVMLGESQASVARSLDMSKANLSKLLGNPRLYGAVPVDGGILMRDGAPVIDADAAVLSVSEWQELRAYLAKPDKAWSRTGGYGRVLRCGVCGDRLYFNANKKKPEHSMYRCKKKSHAPGEQSVSIMAHAGTDLVESGFLARYGDNPYVVTTVRENDSARAEALALANVRVAEIQRLMSAESDPERIAALAQDFAAAHTERARAQAVPVEKVEETMDTGATIAQVWEESSDSFRESLVSRYGHFVVLADSRHLPFADRVEWVPELPPTVVVNGVETPVSVVVGESRASVVLDPTSV